MTRIVLDSNVLVSAMVGLHPNAPSVKIFDAWREGMFDILISEAMLEEVRRTLEKPYFRARLSEDLAARELSLLRKKIQSDADLARGSRHRYSPRG